MTEAELAAVEERCKKCLVELPVLDGEPSDCCRDFPALIRELREARGLLKEWGGNYRPQDYEFDVLKRTRAFLGET